MAIPVAVVQRLVQLAGDHLDAAAGMGRSAPRLAVDLSELTLAELEPLLGEEAPAEGAAGA